MKMHIYPSSSLYHTNCPTLIVAIEKRLNDFKIIGYYIKSTVKASTKKGSMRARRFEATVKNQWVELCWQNIL